MLTREIRVLLLVLVGGAVGLAALVQYTDICRLQAVTLNGQPVRRLDELGLQPGRPVVHQPLDSLADAMLTRRGITSVDIYYKLPNGLRITTNSLDPVYNLLDSRTGDVYGLDETGRVVPVQFEEINWETPLFTGVAVGRLHEHPADGRVAQILRQIRAGRDNDAELFGAIEEIDLSRPDHVLVTLANKPYRVKLRSEQFVERFREFDTFMRSIRPETDSATNFDLTYQAMIIRSGYEPPKEKLVVDTAEVNDKAVFVDEAEMLQMAIQAELSRKESRAQEQAGLKTTTKKSGPAGKIKGPGKSTKKKVSTPTRKKSTGTKTKAKTVKHG